MAACGEACCRFALIHPAAVALFMNMKPAFSGRQPGELGAITTPPALSVKVTVPKDPPTPVALMELIVAVAVAAPAIRVPTKRKLATSKLRIVIELTRNCIPSSCPRSE